MLKDQKLIANGIGRGPVGVDTNCRRPKVIESSSGPDALYLNDDDPKSVLRLVAAAGYRSSLGDGRRCSVQKPATRTGRASSNMFGGASQTAWREDGEAWWRWQVRAWCAILMRHIRFPENHCSAGAARDQR